MLILTKNSDILFSCKLRLKNTQILSSNFVTFFGEFCYFNFFIVVFISEIYRCKNELLLSIVSKSPE